MDKLLLIAIMLLTGCASSGGYYSSYSNYCRPYSTMTGRYTYEGVQCIDGTNYMTTTRRR